MIGQIVVYDQYIAALLHEVLSDAGGGIGSHVAQTRCIAARGDHDDGVYHRAMLAQCRDHLGDPGLALTDGAIDAQHILAALVDDRIQRNGRLTGLTIAEYQFALTAPDRDQRIDDLQTRLQRFRDRRALHDRWRRTLDRQAFPGSHGPLAVKRPPQRIDDAPEQCIPDRHVHDAPGALDFIARLQLPVVAQQHDANLGLIHIECDAGYLARKVDQLLKAHARQSGHGRNSGCDVADRAHLARLELRLETLARAT